MTYPFGYPVASSREAQKSPTGRAFPPASATKDAGSASPSSGHLSSRKLATIEERLSVRDREVMNTLGRFRILSGLQLQRLFWPNGSDTPARLARHGLTRLVRLGVLAPLARTVGGVRSGSTGRCFSLGLAGQRLAAGRPASQPRRPYTPGTRHLTHTLAVAELYVRLVEVQRLGRIEVLAFDPEPSCWRPYSGPWGARLVLKPDAYAKIAAGAYDYSWLIEVDLATESSTTIERKARGHLDYYRSGSEQRERGVTPRVIWIVAGQSRTETVREILSRTGAEADRLFVVTTGVEALGALTSGGQS